MGVLQPAHLKLTRWRLPKASFFRYVSNRIVFRSLYGGLRQEEKPSRRADCAEYDGSRTVDEKIDASLIRKELPIHGILILAFAD
jgi:hypothetical protein